ncbi:alcohol dehydrogenase [Pseudoscourfieldia marina]
MMRAAIYRAFGAPILVENVPRPNLSQIREGGGGGGGGGGVILRVRACGVCRSDHHGWRGHDSDVVSHGLPFVPGHELSGEIVEVSGSSSSKFKVGDAVAVPFILSCGACPECDNSRPTTCEKQQQPGFTQWGGFAEYVAIPHADRNMCHIPENVSFAAAAAVGCRVTTAYRAVVEQGKLKDNATVAVFGAGGVGLSSVLVAKTFAKNTQVLAVDISEAALATASALGADATVRMEVGADPADAAEAAKAALGKAIDITIDAGGFTDTARAALLATRRGGTYVQVGLPLSLPGFTGDHLARVAGHEIHVVGSHGAAPSALPTVLDAISDGRLAVSDLISRELDLEEGAKALMAMDDATHAHPGVSVITRF